MLELLLWRLRPHFVRRIPPVVRLMLLAMCSNIYSEIKVNLEFRKHMSMKAIFVIKQRSGPLGASRLKRRLSERTHLWEPFAMFEELGVVLVFSCGLGPLFAVEAPGVLAGGGGTVAVDAILLQLIAPSNDELENLIGSGNLVVCRVTAHAEGGCLGSYEVNITTVGINLGEMYYIPPEVE